MELPSGGDDRPAAVLCLLFEQGGEASVVLTRRAAQLRCHAGEVSFPGGRLRPGELAREAALREANEEIGVDSGLVEVVGELSPISTMRSPAVVSCFVATFPGPGTGGGALRGDPSEVEEVFWAPLARLVAHGVFHEELWPAHRPGEGGAEGPAYRAVPFFLFDNRTVWGATGRMLTELLSVVMGHRDAGRRAKGRLVT
jgi:8-oxo-dGTP pyrophosphatase MutT (NUDIX family)